MMNRNRCCNDIVIEFENEEEIDVDFSNEITTSKDHSKLFNLDYEHSGHTGFAPDNIIKNRITVDEENEALMFDYNKEA